MISMSSIKSAGGSAKYMTEQAAVEYYANEQAPSQWKGQGAEIQGLAGRDVTTSELTQQLEGKVHEFSKETGEWEEKQLGVMRGGELQHRCGWDLTFAAPKSVSIESEVFGNADVRAAHEAAVDKAMRWLEEKAAQTRVDGEFVKTGNLTYATFDHATSRAGDPQTHTHVVIANVTFVDGEAYSLSNEKLMDYRATCDQVYKNELANELGKLGYQVEWDKAGNFEVTGYSDQNLETFSKRNEQIKDALVERGMDKDTASHSARQAATLDTRQEKDHPEFAEAHRDKWQAEATTAGVKEADRQQPAQLSHGEQMQAAREAVQSAINHLSEREQAFTDRDLWKESAKLAQGQTDTDKIASAIGELQKKGELIERDDGKFTTKEAVDAEKFMAEHLSKGQGAHEAVMNNKEFDTALNSFEERKGFQLSEEQRDASRMILTGDDRFQGVQGLAGTGKTTMLEFVKEAADSKGWEIKGFSNGGAQADKMQQESGIQSSTTARHLIDSDRTAKDAALAEKAIATYEKNSGVFGQKPDWQDLNSQVKSGDATREFDSEKRMFITDKNGETWTPDLYNKVTEIESKNFEHLGLTETKYAVTDAGVFKSGGSLGSEMAGALKEKLNESRVDSVNAKYEGKELSGQEAATMRAELKEARELDNSSFQKVIDATVRAAPNYVLTKGEQWEKCNAAESAVVRGLCERESSKMHESVLSSLKDQASLADGTQSKTLYICDEASMSGQREFNRVIESTEQAGARTVFLGDENQHQAVEAGKGFELAQNHMPMSELGNTVDKDGWRESIRRQTTDYTKEAVSAILDGNHAEAISGLNTREITTHQDSVREKYEGRDDMKTYEKAAMRSELKEAGLADNKEVIRELAKDYTSMARVDRDKTLVITATNQDRTSINNEIRDNLKDQGELQNGKTMDTLEKTGLTEVEASRAINYEKGQVVEFGSDYKSVGVEKGDQITVTHSDNRTNMVFGKTEDGKEVAFNPEKIQNKELYEKVEGKEFAVGDRVTFTKNDRDLDVKNGQIGVVEKFDGKDMTIKMENGEKREFDVKEYQHLDHAYAMTSHKSQGQTYDNVMIHHNTDAGQHGDRETYVNVTRAREDVTVYTQDAEKAAKQSGFAMDKESAITKDSDREVRAERPVEREAGEQTQVPNKDYEQAVQKAEQSMPDVKSERVVDVDQQNGMTDKERQLSEALGVADAIKTSDEFYKNADQHTGMTDKERQLSEALDVAGNIQSSDNFYKNADVRLYEDAIKSVESAIDDRQIHQPEQQQQTSSTEAVTDQGGKDVDAGRGAEPAKERDATSETTSEVAKDHPAAEVVAGQEKTHDDRQSTQPEQQQSSSTEQAPDTAKGSEAVSEQGGKDVVADRGAETQHPKESEAVKDQPPVESVASQDKGQERSPETAQSVEQDQGREPVQSQAEASVAAKQGSEVPIPAEQSQYAEQRLDQWLKEISGVSEKGSDSNKNQEKEVDQSRDGATGQISGNVEGKGRDGESAKEKDADPKSKESKSESKESGKGKGSEVSRRERENSFDAGR